MMKKLDTIENGLTEIETIDRKIVELLDSDDYSQVIDILKNRLLVISQITRMKEEHGGLPEKLQPRFDRIFSNASLIQTRIKEKQSKLSSRLDKHKKTTASNRGRTYKLR